MTKQEFIKLSGEKDFTSAYESVAKRLRGTIITRGARHYEYRGFSLRQGAAYGWMDGVGVNDVATHDIKLPLAEAMREAVKVSGWAIEHRGRDGSVLNHIRQWDDLAEADITAQKWNGNYNHAPYVVVPVFA